ncbi:MAG: chemotaxis protein CheB [Gemmatimonadaceae bacterium]
MTKPPAVVGLGASAGGLDAFLRVLHRLPPDAGLAYVLVQHLSPEHESHLPELLGRAAAIPVVHAEDGMRVEADHAYVIPPNTTLTLTDGHLRLVARKRGRGPHLSVDAFLCSLARVHGSGAVGVILSGSGSDGARGVEAIKEAGGITMAQDSASARHPNMPEAAVATGSIDFILTPEEIAEQLGRLGRHLTQHGGNGATAEASSPPDDEEDLRKIFTLLQRRTGVDFQHYRRGTVHRRILRRMLAHRQESRSEYLAHLRLNPAELDCLYDDLLIGVTSFFRDPEVFAGLQEAGFPELMRSRAPGTPVRVWVAGCSGGEETYSLAIALLEFLGDAATTVPIQIFGTDLSEASVARARAGVYPEGIAAHVSPERLGRFFVAEEGGYRIAKAVRDLCIFSRQNIVRDPPFSHLDLISCRNVLIYLEPPLQRRVFPIFHYALEPHGLLLLGSAESAGVASEFFVPFAKRHKLYRRRERPTRPLDLEFETPTRARTVGAAGTALSYQERPPRPLAVPPAADEVAGEADRQVLARFAPPGVVVNEHLEIIHFRGATAGLFTHAPGAASLDLLRLARPELVMPLRVALSRASVEDRPVCETHIALPDGDAVRHVSIEVLPFRPASTSARFFVVLFTEGPPAVASAPGQRPIANGRRARSATRGEGSDLLAVREELAATKRYLQDIAEQYEASIEELRAASEEIQSSNEELQSTNEELETTKEEVQSANEELTTVNDELRQRNRELAALSADLANVLASTSIPIVIVGSDLRLRRFTPALNRVMKVIPTDTGRPLGDIKLRVSLPDLELRIARAVETLAVTEEEVQDEDGCWWALTIRPYQTADRRVDGAVLVFTDIDASKRYGERAEEASEARRQLLALSEEARTAAEEAREVAEGANRAKASFLASMSHDLRTPLNAIGGYVELLELGLRGPVTEAQLVDMARIKRSARHLLSLINGILNFARVEAGRLELRPADIAMEAMVAELEELVAPQLAAKALQFEHCEVGGTARADPEKVRQALLNLLSNAVKFTPPGGSIALASTADGALVRIEVSDTGRGIPADQLERIFEPFVQVGRGLTTPATDGVGLGLAISRELARAMDGDLTVTSTPGVGSTFTLVLPRAG